MSKKEKLLTDIIKKYNYESKDPEKEKKKKRKSKT